MISKDIISNNLWNAINENVPIKNIFVEKGKVTFDLRKNYFLGKTVCYNVILEKMEEFDNQHLWCTIISQGVVCKEKLNRVFFMDRLNNNTSFNNMSIYLAGILSFDEEQRKRGL